MQAQPALLHGPQCRPGTASDAPLSTCTSRSRCGWLPRRSRACSLSLRARAVSSTSALLLQLPSCCPSCCSCCCAAGACGCCRCSSPMRAQQLQQGGGGRGRSG